MLYFTDVPGQFFHTAVAKAIRSHREVKERNEYRTIAR